jgi:hypothetical protein
MFGTNAEKNETYAQYPFSKSLIIFDIILKNMTFMLCRLVTQELFHCFSSNLILGVLVREVQPVYAICKRATKVGNQELKF